MGSLAWAVGLSILSAASYAGAAVAQERLAENRHRGLGRWAVALALTVSGVGLHVLALNFGTLAVVQALGTLTLLFALPISALRYRVRIIIRFVGDDWKQVTVRAEANWQRGDEWDIGYDSKALDDVATDLRTRIGKRN